MKKDRTNKSPRRPGAEWRLVADTRDGSEAINLSGDGTTEVDEVIVDDWLHVERMNPNRYWVRLGRRIFDVTVSRTTKLPSVVRLVREPDL